MRTIFHEQLDALNEDIADLCNRTATVIQLATEALLNADVDAAEQVIDHGDEVDLQCSALEAETFTILARQAPVARDLRAVLSSMRSVADLQRMGALRSGSLKTPKALCFATIQTERHNCALMTRRLAISTGAYSPS